MSSPCATAARTAFDPSAPDDRTTILPVLASAPPAFPAGPPGSVPPPDSREAAAWLLSQAHECGFADAALAIAPVAEVPSFPLYQAWLSADFAGELTYLARDAAERRDPRLLCQAARSVLSIAVSYHHPDPPPPGPEPALRGQIARYARAEDYHLLLKRRLQALADRVQARYGAALAYRSCVDTAPVLERAIGEGAGLGFIGKNTLLITPGLGSYTLLCELFLDLDLAPLRRLPGDSAPSGSAASAAAVPVAAVPVAAVPVAAAAPAAPVDRSRPRVDGGPKCGSCQLCLDVCPTGALVAPYRLDARRCISYLTIENSGAIPVEFRRAIGTWIFGCDLCQQVCPWNASPTLSARADRDLRPRPTQSRPDLLWLLSLGQAQVRRFVKRTALRRLGRNQLLRNVAVALGNVGTPAEVPALQAALCKEPPLVREHLAWALSEIAQRHPAAGPAVRTALLAALEHEAIPIVQSALTDALLALPP